MMMTSHVTSPDRDHGKAFTSVSTPRQDPSLTAWIERIRLLGEESPSLDAYRLDVMRALRTEVGAVGAVFLPGPPVTLTDGRSLRMVRPLYLDHQPEGFARFVAGHAHFRVELARLGRASLAATPYTDRELFTFEELQRLRAYRDLFEPGSIGSFLTLPLQYQGQPFGQIILLRRLDDPPFEASDSKRIAPLLPLIVMGDRLKAHTRARTLPALGGDTAVRGLTQRERQVADLAATGLQNKTIAANLGLSPNTVRNVLAQVYEKLSVTTRTQLAHVLLGGASQS